MRRLLLGLIAATTACGGDGGDITAPTGSLQITTTTSGATAADYTFSLDGGPNNPIGPNASVTLGDLQPGSHAVQLSNLPEGCTVTGENPRTVIVAAGSTATAAFAVQCTSTGPGTGTIRVTTSTTGSNLDPDGYTLLLDGAASGPMGLEEERTLSDVAAGSHTVELTGVASNCAPAGGPRVTITVISGATVDVSFAVTCTSPTASLIAFNSIALSVSAIFVVNPDGTGLRRVSPDVALDHAPVWSPDGRRILFGSGEDLYVMNADGSSRVKLTDGQGISQYRWSPSGTRIAFVDLRQEGQDLFDDLWVIEADGSARTLLAESASDPSWSPDGQRIAFAAYLADQGLLQIHVINADGSGETSVTGPERAAFQPAWSPDGQRIAFVDLGERDILLVNPDGSGLVNLTQGRSQDDSPTWSPDGSWLAFNTGPSDQPLESEIAVMNRDGSGRQSLTARPGFDLAPDWSPDGSRIVYTRSEPGQSEVYVMNADGSGQINVSNRPDSYDQSADWGGGTPPMVAGRPSMMKYEWRRDRAFRNQGQTR